MAGSALVMVQPQPNWVSDEPPALRLQDIESQRPNHEHVELGCFVVAKGAAPTKPVL